MLYELTRFVSFIFQEGRKIYFLYQTILTKSFPGRTAVATGLEKVNFHSNHKGSAEEYSNYHTIALISHSSKVMLKILQARLQQYMNWELPDVKAGFRKGRRTRDQIANIHWIIKKAREF